jgi:hypothetical protein
MILWDRRAVDESTFLLGKNAAFFRVNSLFPVELKLDHSF